MGSWNRRGMSPLIATVLLMAFAVALGGLIMNWTSRIGDQSQSLCEKVELEKVVFCYSDTAIKFRVRNEGEINIEKVTLNVEAPGGPSIPVLVPDSMVLVDKSISSEIPFGVSEGTKGSLSVTLRDRGKDVLCEEPILAETLAKC